MTSFDYIDDKKQNKNRTHVSFFKFSGDAKTNFLYGHMVIRKKLKIAFYPLLATGDRYFRPHYPCLTLTILVSSSIPQSNSKRNK